VPQRLRAEEVGVTVPITLAWWRDGERHFDVALGRIADAEFDRPSLLLGWSRRQLLAHVARNADALVNLCTWARTGVETPMYASSEERQAGIAQAAALPSAELRAEVLAAADRLAEAVRGMPDDAWSAQVCTAQGRTVPAAEAPWMRCREVWVHAVDLDVGLGFGDVPDDVLTALVDDVFRAWGRRDQTPSATVSAGNRTWGAGSVTVSGPLPMIAGWVTGRTGPDGLTSDAVVPDLQPWL